MKLFLSEIFLVAVVGTGTGLIGGYFIGKRAADNYYHSHPYIPRLSDIQAKPVLHILYCQFDNDPVVGDYVIPSQVSPGYCHDTGDANPYSYRQIEGRVLSINGNRIGLVRMNDSSN